MTDEDRLDKWKDKDTEIVMALTTLLFHSVGGHEGKGKAQAMVALEGVIQGVLMLYWVKEDAVEVLDVLTAQVIKRLSR